MVPPIVIGAHPKRHDQESIELGVMLSRLTGAPMDVVGTFWFDSTPQRKASDEYSEALREEVRRSIEHAVGDPGRAPGEIRTHVLPGGSAHALLDTAEEVGAGAIVVGSSHRGAVGRIALSTTADRVLDGARCPVFVAPRGFRDEGTDPQTVGVAYVDTEGGRSAMRAGAAIARRTGAKLIAYTVIEGHAPGADRDRAMGAVHGAIEECASGLDAEARTLTDGGIEALVNETQHLDLLVRGSRGRGPMRPPLAFGLPSKLAQRAACPFAIVPPEREAPLLALFGAGAGGQREAVSL